MRAVLSALLVASCLSACSSGLRPSPTLTCQSDYDRCIRREGAGDECEDYRAACVTRAAAANEQRIEKQRGYEEFLRERGDADAE